MEIREAKTKEDRESIFRLRYQVLVEELGWTIGGADHERRFVIEPLDDASILVGAFEEGEVLGSLRINLGRDGSLEAFDQLYSFDRDQPYYPEQVGVISKLVAAKEHRNSLMLPRMLLWIYGLGLKWGVVRAYLDCSVDLIPFYEKLGFTTYTDDVETEEYGVIAPMRLDLGNIEYLEQIRSPLCRVLSHYQQGHIDAYLESCGREDGEEFQPWGYGTGFPTTETEVHVFDGLSKEELKLAFRAAAIKDYEDSEAIVVSGDPSWEFGVVLKGRAAVWLTLDGKKQVVALFSRGQVLGEMGFLLNAPRSATITALGECRVATFPSPVVEHLLRKKPGIAVHIFRNLAMILARRLAHAHDWLGDV